MIETFKASNGWYIDRNGLIREPGGYCIVSSYGADNFRQFFQELRDHELGRWRDPELTQAVCYPSEHGVSVLVFHERYGESRVFYRDDDFGETADAQVAKRYFEAHPEHKPLPTVGGFYVNRSHARALGDSQIISNRGGVWRFVTSSNPDAEAIAQRWHDAGELVRLAPVESEATDD